MYLDHPNLCLERPPYQVKGGRLKKTQSVAQYCATTKGPFLAFFYPFKAFYKKNYLKCSK